MGLNAQQRRDLFPLDSYDVPVNSLIYQDRGARTFAQAALERLGGAVCGSGFPDAGAIAGVAIRLKP